MREERLVFQSPMSPLHAWGDFYVIAGTAAASLTGLMFVVITLVASLRTASTRQGIATFSTPTVVKFSFALGIALVLAAPWPTLYCAATLLALAAVGGTIYASVTYKRARDQVRAADGVDYEPDAEDRWFYAYLPLIEYVAILIAALMLPFRPHAALFVLCGATMLLIFNGIHNAWDVVTFVTAKRLPQADGGVPRDVSAESSET